MGLFRPYEQGKTESEPRRRRPRGATRADLAAPAPVEAETATLEPAAPRQPHKKGAPTPTRAQAQAARMERLHPTLSPKQQRQANREAERSNRARAMEAIEQTPARQLVRDHVDSQLTLTEWAVPLMLGIFVVSMFFPRNFAVQQGTSLVMLVLFLLGIANIVWVRHTLRREAARRGVDVRQRGMTMYLVNRMMNLRAVRRPAPRVKRGEGY